MSAWDRKALSLTPPCRATPATFCCFGDSAFLSPGGSCTRAREIWCSAHAIAAPRALSMPRTAWLGAYIIWLCRGAQRRLLREQFDTISAYALRDASTRPIRAWTQVQKCTWMDARYARIHRVLAVRLDRFYCSRDLLAAFFGAFHHLVVGIFFFSLIAPPPILEPIGHPSRGQRPHAALGAGLFLIPHDTVARFVF